MSEQSFTPGPWEQFPEEDGYIRVRGTRIGGRFKIANVLAQQDYDGSEGREGNETRANARLIAAAPDMHKALEAYGRAFDELFSNCLSNGLFNAWGGPVNCTALNVAKQLGDAAIAKATEISP